MILFVLSGNILVIVVIARTPMLQNCMNQFVTWLAVSDVVSGFSILLRIPQALGYLGNAYLCLFRFYTINASGIMSGLACLGKIQEDNARLLFQHRMIVIIMLCPVHMTARLYYDL